MQTRSRSLILIGVCAILSAGTLGSSAAQATSVASKRAQARIVERQIHQFDARLEASIQAYDKARFDLGKIRAQIKTNTLELAIARHNLRVAQDQLGALLVASYKGDGSSDVVAYVLGAGSFIDLVNRVEYLDRASKTKGELLAQIRRSKIQIEERQRELKTAENRAEALVKQAATRRAAVRTGLAARQKLLDSIHSDIKRLIAEQERRREARAATAAAAAEQAPSSPAPPSTGGAPPSTGGAPPSNGGAPPSNGTLGQQAVQIAMQYLGVPYVWGGASPNGFDCSGLTMYVYAQLGISLPHYTGAQWTAGPHVARNQLQPGDLVFFESNLGHMGMYIGGGSFIHAPHTGDVVKISSLSDPWYSSEYQGAVRVTG